MKYFHTILVLWITLSLCSQTYNVKGNLLWEIRTPQGTSYLFGTLHSNDKRLFDFPDSVYASFLSCNKLAVEVNVFDLFMDKDPIPNRSLLLLDKRGKLYTANDDPTTTYYGNEDGMPQFMDAWFQEKAELLNKEVIALESLAQQTKAIEEIPYVEKEKNSSWMRPDNQVLHDLYLDGRIDLIDRLIKGGLSSNKEAYIKLIENRNIAMAENIAHHLMAGPVFFAVGAGHLYGEKGLLSLLRDKGFKLRAIKLTKGDKPSVAEQKLKSIRSYEFSRELKNTMLKFSVPGLPRETRSEMEDETVLIYKELGQGNTYEVRYFERDTSLSLLEYSEILIASPMQSPYVFGILDDGTEFTQGLSDAYPDGLKWTRILVNETFVLIASCSGGNKFMNSDRPRRFFNNILLE
ncbi:MAG: TraB/GumN family protein [Flavobacteriales bacterium]